MCTDAQVVVQSKKRAENEDAEIEGQYCGKIKKRMAVITTIRFLTIGYIYAVLTVGLSVGRRRWCLVCRCLCFGRRCVCRRQCR